MKYSKYLFGAMIVSLSAAAAEGGEQPSKEELQRRLRARLSSSRDHRFHQPVIARQLLANGTDALVEPLRYNFIDCQGNKCPIKLRVVISNKKQGEIAAEYRIEGTNKFTPRDLEIVQMIRESFMYKYPLVMNIPKGYIGIDETRKQKFSQEEIDDLVTKAREKQGHNNGGQG